MHFQTRKIKEVFTSDRVYFSVNEVFKFLVLLEIISRTVARKWLDTI